MSKKINYNHLAAAIILLGGGAYGLYAGLIDGFNGYFFIPSCAFVFLGAIYARNVKVK
ncbi:hypothetical protein [Sinanaerobacter chloroacetimidivorans]|jgi:hypothetical protein|uniref:Uncharacterized protein n=1 Tax=Sinanaerobacter chloroacetimidivorans TaxID=2818044 RepID=A0A8J7VZB2_9FIRM|nr:hypothetical protein [Sinanaerobacter chloroacetimidivorans]MBR0597469.1 hypothetical protein [Sinanaerobacter chloroacetimidivorans]